MSDQPSSPISPPGPSPGDQPPLTDEQRMLIDLRDVLYEGSWEDFRVDLNARRQSKPHVFDTVPETPRTQSIIDLHLRLIGELEEWEHRYGCRLRGTT